MSEVKVNKISPRTNCGTVTVGDSGDSVSVSAGVPVTVNGDLKSNALKATDGGSIFMMMPSSIIVLRRRSIHPAHLRVFSRTCEWSK